MRGRCGSRLALLLIASLMTQTADAQQFGVSYLPRALCVTDPYGVPFHNWYGAPVAYNSYFSMSSNGTYSSGYNGATTGYFLGGVPAVASATTPEWIVQRTSVFPINSYYPGAQYPRTYPAPPPTWTPGFGKQQTPPNPQSSIQRETASPRTQDTHIQQVSGALPLLEKERSPDIAAGDSLFRESQYSAAYLCYLAAQREAGDHSEVYFRQAFTLIAMRKYSHAVAKLKRGLQVEPDALQHAATLDEVFGTEGNAADQAKKTEWLDQVSQWAKADARDLDRLFLMGVMLHCERDPRAEEFLNTAAKQARRNQPSSQ